MRISTRWPFRGLSVGDFSPRRMSWVIFAYEDCPWVILATRTVVDAHNNTFTLPWTVRVLFAHEDSTSVHISARWPFPWTVRVIFAHEDCPSMNNCVLMESQRGLFTDAGSIKSFPAVVADHPTKCYHFPLFFRGLIEAKRTEGMNYIKPAAMIPVDTTEEPTSKDQKQRRYERLGCHKPVIPVNQASFYPFVPHEISVLVELILGHLRYLLTDVRPSQTPHLTMSSAGSTAKRVLGLKKGLLPASDSRSK
ncbi:hypothetical protein Bca4012_102936 [Brassica carinata]